MKNIIKSTLLLGLAAVAFVACDKDIDSNPTLQTPSTFKLNTPSYSQQVIELANSTSLNFTWSQPDYGMPLSCKYGMQFSLDGNYTVSVDQSTADESGTLVANYWQPSSEYTVPSATVNADDLAKGLMQIAKWSSDDVPAEQVVYARAFSSVNNDTIYSNVVSIKVVPYYIELSDAAPEIWYLVGGIIGDGSWGNSVDGIGTSLLPMYTKAGAEYDKKTGTGEIEWAGYLPVGEFKIVKTPGDWTHGFVEGSVDSPEDIWYRNGEEGNPDNIKVNEAGVYKITINTKDITINIEKLEGTTAYTTMYASGDFNSWTETSDEMTPMTTCATECHNWKFEVTGATTIKFLQAGWSPNWGDSAFPYGVGVTNGANIPVSEGNWVVYFNDITGAYYFYAK